MATSLSLGQGVQWDSLAMNYCSGHMIKSPLSSISIITLQDILMSLFIMNGSCTNIRNNRIKYQKMWMYFDVFY